MYGIGEKDNFVLLLLNAFTLNKRERVFKRDIGIRVDSDGSEAGRGFEK